MEDFEKIITRISKPEIHELKHQPMLEDQLIRARRKTALTWWWTALPLYVVCALIMKSLYYPSSSPAGFILEFINNRPAISMILFGVIPVLAFIINFTSLRKIYFYSGTPFKELRVPRPAVLPLAIAGISLGMVICYCLTLLLK